MRVISGTARGTKLNSIEDLSTRPTLDRVKESLFNIIQDKIRDALVLDLFAGSGAIAIEFLSRGCQKAYLCDSSHKAIEMIKQNLNKTRLQGDAVVIEKDYIRCLQELAKKKVSFDIIFIDPPYKADIAVDSVKRILELKLLNDEGIIVIETDEESREIEELKELDVHIYDVRKYGRAHLIFLN